MGDNPSEWIDSADARGNALPHRKHQGIDSAPVQGNPVQDYLDRKRPIAGNYRLTDIRGEELGCFDGLKAVAKYLNKSHRAVWQQLKENGRIDGVYCVEKIEDDTLEIT